MTNNINFKFNILSRLNKEKLSKFIVLTIPLIFCFIIIVLTNDDSLKTENNNQVFAYNRGWTLSYQDKEKKINDLPLKASVKRGQKYYIKNIVPSVVNNETYLILRSSKQDVHVFVNGKTIYKYKNDFLKNKTLFIPLKKEYAGQSIKIMLSSDVGIYSGRVDKLYYGQHLDGLLTQLKFVSKLLLFYVFLIICGLMIITLYFILLIKKKKYPQFLFIGIFTILLAIVMVTDNNLLQFLSINQYINLVVSIIVKLMLPYSFIGCIYSESKSLRTRKYLKYIIYVLVNTNIFMFLMTFYQKKQLVTFLTMYQLITIVTFFVLMAMVLIEIAVDENFHFIDTYIAMSFLGFTIVVEIISYFQYVVDYYNTGIFLGAGLFSFLLIKVSVILLNIINRIEDTEKIKQQLFDSRIREMLNQIKPHFIYNTLNTIQALIDIEPSRASDLITKFSKYLRTHIDTIGQENLITFEEELSNIKVYTDIEQVRFPKIKVVFNIQSKDFLVPMLSIQPLVENAIKHGVSKKIKGGTVFIKTYENNMSYFIVINDNGVGFKATDKGELVSVGIKNTSFRLNNLINADLKCESVPDEGTNILITIPKRNV